MNDAYFEILEYLYNRGINTNADIYHILNKKYPKDNDYGSDVRNTEIDRFLTKIKDFKYLEYIIHLDDKDNPDDCDMKIFAHLTAEGFQFLIAANRDKSTLETNKTLRRYTRGQTVILAFVMITSALTLYYTIIPYKTNAIPAKSLQTKPIIQEKPPTSIQKQDTNIQHLKSQSIKKP